MKKKTDLILTSERLLTNGRDIWNNNYEHNCADMSFVPSLKDNWKFFFFKRFNWGTVIEVEGLGRPLWGSETKDIIWSIREFSDEDWSSRKNSCEDPPGEKELNLLEHLKEDKCI